MTAAVVSIDPSLHHPHRHPHHYYNTSPYGHQQQQQPQPHHQQQAVQQQQQQQVGLAPSAHHGLHHPSPHSTSSFSFSPGHSAASTPTAAGSLHPMASPLSNLSLMQQLSSMNGQQTVNAAVAAIQPFRSSALQQPQPQQQQPQPQQAQQQQQQHVSPFHHQPNPFAASSNLLPFYASPLYSLPATAATSVMSASGGGLTSLPAPAFLASGGFPGHLSAAAAAGLGSSAPLSAWPPVSSNFSTASTTSTLSSSHLSAAQLRVATPDSSPSTPTNFSSSWTDRALVSAQHAHTFHADEQFTAKQEEQQQLSQHQLQMLQQQQQQSADALSDVSGEKEEGAAGSQLMTRSTQLMSRRLPPLSGSSFSHSARRRGSSHALGSSGSAQDERQLELLLRSVRLSVQKMEELLASPSPVSAADSPLLGIKTLLLNAANAAASAKKRKSVDDTDTAGGVRGGVDSPVKRRMSRQRTQDGDAAGADDDAMPDDDEQAAAASGAAGFSIHEVKSGLRSRQLSASGEAGEAADESESESDSECGELGFEESDSPRTSCKPCPLVASISKKPLKVLYVNVQRQFTVSKKETVKMPKEDKERLVPVHVRIMGSAARGGESLYFVAKDVCLLIHTRKGNVAKSIGQFKEDEKVRMSVVCPRSNGTVSTHILTALTVKGVRRLLSTSRSPLAGHVLKWIMKQVDALVCDYQEDRKQKTIKKQTMQAQAQHAAIIAAQASAAAAAAAAAAPAAPLSSALLGNGSLSRNGSPQQPAVRKISQDSDGSRGSFSSSAKSSPSTSPASSSSLYSQHMVPVVPLAPLSPSLRPHPLVAPLQLQSDSAAVVKPAPVLFNQPDRKTASLPPSPTPQSSAGGIGSGSASSLSCPSTPTGSSSVVSGVASPHLVTRSAFSKVGLADGDGSPSKRVSPTARLNAATGPLLPPVAPLQSSAADCTAAAPAATSAGKAGPPSLTTLLEAIKVQNTDK